jgi:hypothetical protein
MVPNGYLPKTSVSTAAWPDTIRPFLLNHLKFEK